MNMSPQPKPDSHEFDIHNKLKASNSHWSYLYAAQSRDDGFNYQFMTVLIDEPEFAVYERIDNYFILVDFFNSYEDACDRAKEIIDSHPDLVRMLATS
ncbi:hypothetical protein [Huaxiibacter chinensis]